MKRILIAILATLVLFAGCTKQAEYGPKAPREPSRYSEEGNELSFWSSIYTVTDRSTGETWAIWYHNEAAVLLRHTAP